MLDYAQISGHAKVSGDSVIEGHSKISGNAQILDSLVRNATVTGAASINSAEISGGHWDGSEGEIHGGHWIAPGVPAPGVQAPDPQNQS